MNQPGGVKGWVHGRRIKLETFHLTNDTWPKKQRKVPVPKEILHSVNLPCCNERCGTQLNPYEARALPELKFLEFLH